MYLNTNQTYTLNPTFKDAQALFSAYATLQSNDVLVNALHDVFGMSYSQSLGSLSLREIYNHVILKYYPNETCVKASFINEILFRTKNHVTIFELPVGNSRIDLCKINGTSVAYEIKTDLDNLSRLEKQLNDYLQIFEQVFVICSKHKLPYVEQIVLPACGIYTYSVLPRGKYKFKLHRKAMASNSIDSKKQLSIFQKRELVECFNPTIRTNRVDMEMAILEKYPATFINEQFKRALKTRYFSQWEFLQGHRSDILEIDYQWFFKNQIDPDIIYS